MRKLSPLLLLLFILSLNTIGAQTKEPAISANKNRDKLIGNILKNTLESYHYLGLTLDNSISQKAFAEFLKRMDYGKQFFLKSDIKTLEKFQFELDDQMINGENELVIKTEKIIRESVERANKWREELFAKGFDFKQNEELELDPDKRDYPTSLEEQKEYWRLLFKQATLTRYLDLMEERSELINPTADSSKKAKDKEKDKNKKSEVTKTMSEQEIMEKSVKAMNEKYERIFARILKEDHDDQMEKFYNSLTTVFDPHTVYMPPKKKEDFDIDISGSLEGIGAVLSEEGPYIKVVTIVPGGAAWRQKELEVEDMILSVGQGDKEPVSLVDMRVDDAVRYIRGAKGTEVRLTVKKVDGTRKTISIIRDVVEIGASFAKSSVLQHKDLGVKIGYINVPKFYRDFDGAGTEARNCSDDVKKELERLKKQKVDGVILDLRNNGGGALEDARIMTGLFIKEGPVVQIRNHRGQVEVLRDTDTSITYDGPLVVLTNRFSASASEIVAGAIQDYKRGLVVGGEYSHGKGTVQAVLNLNQAPLLSMFGPTMGALKVTIQKFYRVTGGSTQYKGVTPDIILPDTMGYAKNREQDLDYSLKWDSVSAQKFSPWTSKEYDLDLLKKRSQARVKSDKRINKIVESVAYFSSRRDDTKMSLNLEKVMQEEKESKEMTKKFKLDDTNEKVLVSHFEESLKTNSDIKPGDEEKWKKDFDQKKEEWITSLQQDAILEESLFIVSDMVELHQGKKLSFVKGN